MNTSSSFSLRGLYLGLIALLLGAVAVAAETPLVGPGESVATVGVPVGLSAQQVQEAIVATLTGRGWTVQEKTDEKVVGYYKRHRNEALVTLKYNDKQVEIFCVGYVIDRNTGERKTPELPKTWLNYVKSDLVSKLGKATIGK